MSACGKWLVVFGGLRNRACLNDAAALDTERMVWQPLEVEGARPPARGNHAAVVLSTAGAHRLWVFGGDAPASGFAPPEAWALQVSPNPNPYPNPNPNPNPDPNPNPNPNPNPSPSPNPIPNRNAAAAGRRGRVLVELPGDERAAATRLLRPRRRRVRHERAPARRLLLGRLPAHGEG